MVRKVNSLKSPQTLVLTLVRRMIPCSAAALTSAPQIFAHCRPRTASLGLNLWTPSVSVRAGRANVMEWAASTWAWTLPATWLVARVIESGKPSSNHDYCALRRQLVLVMGVVSLKNKNWIWIKGTTRIFRICSNPKRWSWWKYA